MVPVFTVARSMKEEPDFALRHRHDYPAAVHRGLRQPTLSWSEVPPPASEVRAAPGPYPTDLSRFGFEGRLTPIPLVLLFITLAGPAPSVSAGTSRLCQDCSRPFRHLPDQAVLSFVVLLRQDQRRWSLTSARINSASRRTGWKPNVRFQVAAAFSFSEWAMLMVASTSMTSGPASSALSSGPAPAAHALARVSTRDPDRRQPPLSDSVQYPPGGGHRRYWPEHVLAISQRLDP